MKFIFFTILLFITHTSYASVVYSGKIAGLLITADSNNTAVVSFDVADASFLSSCPYKRVKFDKSNKEVLSYMMSLYMSEKNVSFYVNPNGNTLGGIPGHGMGNCELESIWVDGA